MVSSRTNTEWSSLWTGKKYMLNDLFRSLRLDLHLQICKCNIVSDVLIS